MCTAAHCSALQCTTTHCNALQGTATHCNTRNHEKRPADSLLTNVRTAVPPRQYLRCAEAYETCQQRFQRREKYVKRDVFVRKETCKRNSHDTHTTIPWACSGIRNMSEETHFMCVSLLQASFRTSRCL